MIAIKQKKGALMRSSVSRKFWSLVKNCFQDRKGKKGRPRMNARKAFFGILYVLNEGSRWHSLPSKFGKPSTVHGTYMRWLRDGTIRKIKNLLSSSYLASQPEMPYCFLTDTSSSKAPFAQWSGKNPTDRRKRGIKKSIITDHNGVPLAVTVGPANRHDSQFLKETFDELPHCETNKQKILLADAAYDAAVLKKYLKRRGFLLIAVENKRRKKVVEKRATGFRWKVEPTHSWLHNFRGVKTCWAKTEESFLGFLQLAASIIAFRKTLFFG
jgi:transposase